MLARVIGLFSGRGAVMHTQAGIKVDIGLMEVEAEELNAEADKAGRAGDAGQIRILSEDDFCRLAGVQPPEALKKMNRDAMVFAMAARNAILPLVAGRARDLPEDLAGLPFDDPKLSLRLGRLLEALEPEDRRRPYRLTGAGATTLAAAPSASSSSWSAG